MERSQTNKYIIGITAGDINGVGYEVIFKTFEDPMMYNDCTVVIYGSSKVASFHRKLLNMPTLNPNLAKSIDDCIENRINIININEENVRVDIGKSSVQAGKCSAEALERAVEDLKNEAIDILITAPINKNNVNEAGFNFPGHTEYLAQSFDTKDYLMLMASEKLKIGVVTTHLPIKEVSENITVEKIVDKLKIINKTLREDFVIRKPRIAVLGLNPHAGDNGLLGKEELEIIIPAIQEANNQDITAFGPYPADGFFASENYKKFDAVLAMYHDQGLIPFKVIAGQEGVNYTAGLPIIRVSPDHGTAYDIAGKGIADPTSFKAALYMGIDIFNNRNMIKGIHTLEKLSNQVADKKIC